MHCIYVHGYVTFAAAKAVSHLIHGFAECIGMHVVQWANLEPAREAKCSIQELSIEQTNSTECHKHTKIL